MKILLADDDLRYSLAIKRILENEGYDVTYAGNGGIAIEEYKAIRPDIVLLDINMPEKNGFEVAKEIRKSDQKTLIFFLTDRTDKEDRLQGFNVRANDYIAKPFYPEELIARIKERTSYNTLNDTATYKFGNTTFDYTKNEIRYESSSTTITSRQSDILRILAENKNSIVDRTTILTSIWGSDIYANSLSLNVQMALIRRAIKDKSVEIKSVSKRGYMLTDDKD